MEIVLSHHTYSCIFKNSNYSIDLSPLKDQSWSMSSYNSEYGGTFSYHISLCSRNLHCQNDITFVDGTQSCQTEQISNFEIGNMKNGSYIFNPTEGRTLQITYLNSQKQYSTGCGATKYRNSTYSFICSPNVTFSFIEFSESPKCIYNFIISSKYACPIQNPTESPTQTPTKSPTQSPTESPTESLTQTPTTPSTPTQSPSSSKISCRVTNSSIVVKSPKPIYCTANGPTFCTSSCGSTCSTEDINGNIKCSSPSPSISCIGSNIQCETSDVKVNNIVIGSDIFDSTLNQTIQKEKDTSFGNTIKVSLCFSTLFIILSLLL
ncbi:hypothetical protein ACTA71_002268 [Dictyostelium dimigraforme]